MTEHLISVEQLTEHDVDALFALARNFEESLRKREILDIAKGAILANLFFEPSTRTRISFGAAFIRLGGAVCDTAGIEASSLVKGESLRDTARVVSGYVDIIVLRHPEVGATQEFASNSKVPVISAGDGTGEHPTQALLDLYTLRKELGSRLDGLTIAIVGDLKHGRTVHSLTKILTLYRAVRVIQLSPPGLELPADVRSYAVGRGVTIETAVNFEDALRNADVVYMTRVQGERFRDADEYEKVRGALRLDLGTYRRFAKKQPLVMHPLPRDSREKSSELPIAEADLPQLAIFRQTDNGIPIRMALFARKLARA